MQFSEAMQPPMRPRDGKKCDRAPKGWYCTRAYGHGGPCAAKARWWKEIAMFLENFWR